MVEKDRTLATYGINAVCTHLGCVVPFNTAEKKFICPCHGSQYNDQGRVVRGPAPLVSKLEKPFLLTFFSLHVFWLRSISFRLVMVNFLELASLICYSNYCTSIEYFCCSCCMSVSGIGTLWCGWWEGGVCSLGRNRFQNWWCSMVGLEFLKLCLGCHIFKSEIQTICFCINA